jgi:hypothetical protein
MIFIAYWELNNDFEPSELASVAQTLLNKKLFPEEGTNIIAWYISATDNWGVLVVEAENEEQMVRTISMWRIAKPGIFRLIKTSPGVEITKILPMVMKLAKQMKE